MPFDLFISYASEDCNGVARPLAHELRRRGWSVWFAESELMLGDSLTESIDHGLAEARYGLVILSPSFFAKRWPQRELIGLTTRELASGRKVILPVWHDVDHAYVARFSPPLADKLAARSIDGVEVMVDQIVRVLDRIADGQPLEPTDGPIAPSGSPRSGSQTLLGLDPTRRKAVSAHLAFGRFHSGAVIPSDTPKWVFDEEIPCSQQGSHSRVWRGHSIEGGQKVAIKLMLAVRGSRADDNAEYKRAQNEITRLHDLRDNVHVVPLLGFGVEGEVHYCVMPLASQGSLASYYAPAMRPMRPLSEVLYVAATIIEALRATDPLLYGSGSASVAHRDIKPENILLHDNAAVYKGCPEVWLADWGVSLPHGASAAVEDVAPATVACAAPQAMDRSKPVHILDDIYSIGLLLWWCVTGTYARWDEMLEVPLTEAELLKYAHVLAQKREQLPSLAERYPRLPEDVEAFIKRSLRYERHARTPIPEEDSDRRQILSYAKSEVQRLINQVDELEVGNDPIMVGPGAATNGGPRSTSTETL